MAAKPRKRKRKRGNENDHRSHCMVSPLAKRLKKSVLSPSDSINHLQNELSVRNSDESDLLQFKYESDFDENGFIFYLGTNKHTCNTFKNPAHTKLVKITSTELQPDSQSNQYIVDRKCVRLVTRPIHNASFTIDFRGTEYDILPTHYTLRHYESWDTEALRNWCFEGSNDGTKWSVIKKHHKDTSLNKKGQSHTWNTDGDTYYTVFRIFQYGPNSHGNDYLACSGFEIYGYVRNQKYFHYDMDDSDLEILPNSPKKPAKKQRKASTPKQETDDDDDDDDHLTMNNLSDALEISPKELLLSMGYNEYLVNECMKYMDTTGDILTNAMDWLNTHQMTECEINNNNIMTLSTICESARYEALYALKQSNHDMDGALNILLEAKATDLFTHLSTKEMEDLQMEDSVLSASISCINDKRKQQQQFKRLKPFIVSELRSMGFLQIVVHKAVNDASVTDKKSAIQYILSHPMDNIQENAAKIQEITNSGYSRNDAITALNTFSQNLDISMSWLMQSKPLKINHFVYHVASKNVMQISGDNVLSLCSDFNHFKNVNQHFSIYENGIIKIFANNQILVVIKYKKDNVMDYRLSLISDDDDNDSEYIFKYWDMDCDEKTIQNKECGLFLVHRDGNGFKLETNIHCGDLSQRWCVVDHNELAALNPKELAQLLDSQEYECVICWENEPNLRLQPCGHSTFCAKCINELNPEVCPICRTEIHSKREFI